MKYQEWVCPRRDLEPVKHHNNAWWKRGVELKNSSPHRLNTKESSSMEKDLGVLVNNQLSQSYRGQEGQWDPGVN